MLSLGSRPEESRARRIRGNPGSLARRNLPQRFIQFVANSQWLTAALTETPA
jgi:hypothetical protein